jgi:hypothetical protein
VAAPEPVAVAEPESESEDDGPEMLPFKHNGEKYLRLGNTTADGIDWSSGDLWLNKKGAKGDYIGMLQEDGTIDKNAEEPILE